MGRASPQLLYVDFKRHDSGEKIGDKVLAGLYDIDGEHHGRPVYRKRRTDVDKSHKSIGSGGKASRSKDVILHYWDGDGKTHAEEDIGWWFGSHIGASEVWAFHDKDSPEPPAKGWIFCDFFGVSADELELVIEPRCPRTGGLLEQGAAREEVAAPLAQPVLREDPPNRSGRLRSDSGDGRDGGQSRIARSRSRSDRRRNERRTLGRSSERARKWRDPDKDGAAGRGLQGLQDYSNARLPVKEERRSRSRRRSPRKAARRRFPSLRVRTASPSPTRRVYSRPGRAEGDRASLLCANPTCWFLVHPDPAYGGFCCRKCHWCFSTGSKSKNKHGQQCKKIEGSDEHARRAEAIAPTNPLSLG